MKAICAITAVAAAALAAAPSSAPGDAPNMAWTRFENRAQGHAVRHPPGWHAVTRRDGATIVSSAPLDDPDAAPKDVRVPSETGAYVFVFDYGVLPRGADAENGAPRTLGRATTHACGFGYGHNLHFRLGRHQLHAFVKFGPRPLPATRARALTVLRSLRLTPRAHELANVHSVRVLGRSTRGRPIRAWRIGNPQSDTKILVVGCIHGTECAGMAVTQRLVNLTHPIAADLWVVQNLNPDGLARGVRQNGRGVDLNRNFPSRWKPIGRRWSPQYSGPRPLSEPETRLARDLIRRLRPDFTIWYQPAAGARPGVGPSVAAARRYARAADVPYRSLRWPNGTAPNWQNHRFPGTSSFVVELPRDRLSRREIDRHVAAILRLAR